MYPPEFPLKLENDPYTHSRSTFTFTAFGRLMLIYHYFIYIPYFNTVVSVAWGSLICNYCWLSINALLMMIIDVYGHIIIICIGIPVVIGVVYNLRQVRIRHVMLTNIEQIKSEIDALTQIIILQQMIQINSEDKIENVTLIGIVNLYVLECQNQDCPCKNESELFDASIGKFSQRNVGHHRDNIFLKHFVKRIYEDFINKFSNTALLHIEFSFYMFSIMKNNHAALQELNIAEKKKPSIQQEFVIYRMKLLIGEYIQEESFNLKEEYSQLTYVIEFEELVSNCQKTIEKVAKIGRASCRERVYVLV